MLDMGFRPAVDRIVAQCPADRQTLFFSATLDGEAGRIAAVYTTDAVRHEHRPAPEHVGEIEHRFRAVDRDTRIDALVDELDGSERAIVFVRTKRGADRLVKRLGNEGVRAVAMHGNKSQNQRERALAEFTAGKVDTLVATDVAARGIDVVRHLARDQLRRARRPRELRAPHRPHGPRRRAPASGSPSSRPSRPATSARSPTRCACTPSSSARASRPPRGRTPPVAAAATGAAAPRAAAARARAPSSSPARRRPAARRPS